MKQKLSPYTIKKIFKRLAIGLAVLLLVLSMPSIGVGADSYDDQIQQLEAEAEGYLTEAGRLRGEANNLQNEISAITAQQRALETQIDATEAKLQQITNDIANTELRIQNVKTALAENLRSIYVEGDISPLEMAASSNSISDYIDKEEARNKINQAIGKNIERLATLKSELATQKQDAERVLADQKSLRTQLATQEQQKNQLLAETQGQEASYQQLVTQKNSEVESLREAQRKANARFFGGASYAGTGNYPWPDEGGDNWSMYSCYPDKWGMCKRQCVSYTAWKVESTGRYMPNWGGVGNANEWPGNAEREGIPVDGTPRVGDVAISYGASPWGHAMYVESVNNDGTINISQYNAAMDGRYSTNIIPSSGLVFIHF